jgi:hypothetical protein
MFSPHLVFEISFESILGFQSFGAEENYLSIFAENASAYVNLPHKDAYFLFETPYHMATKIVGLFQQIRSESGGEIGKRIVIEFERENEEELSESKEPEEGEKKEEESEKKEERTNEEESTELAGENGMEMKIETQEKEDKEGS